VGPRGYGPSMTSPAVRLEPMTDDQYARYRLRAEDSYAEGIHGSGAMSLAAARTKSAEDYARLLPDGLATEGNRLWTAYDGDEEVGVLWLAFTDTDEGVSAFGFDFEVREDLRRHGYGRAIMQAAEQVCRELGVVRVGLSVFGDNLGAQALYEQMGFRVSAIQMTKRL
jgi:GNAT superfamily N-acetyltransferase